MSAVLLALILAQAAPAQEAATAQLRQARAAYDYGNYTSAAEELERLIEGRQLERTQDQIEAFRLLGLAHFFAGQPAEAARAFVNVLSLNPDLQLDPLYVPPRAIAFFNQVRDDNRALLEPIRQRQQATRDAIAEEEAARQRLLAQAGTRPAPPTVVRERIDRPSAPVALLPFGIGQFQNGNRPLGITFAVAEALAVGTSIGCFLWVEGNRGSDGFYAPGIYHTAQIVEAVQFGTGLGFGALWVAGATEALLRLRGPVVTQEDTSGAPVAAPQAPAKISFSLGPSRGGFSAGLNLGF